MAHAEGNGTKATHKAQHVFGTSNVPDPSTAAGTSKGTYVEIVGNGTGASASQKSNARTLDWNGNEYLKGDVHVNCDSNSANGKALGAAVGALEAKIPDAPTEDGVYVLQATVSSGSVTYAWVSAT